jgi:hypothetical protein
MPHFEEFYENKLRGTLGLADAAAVLDLTGVAREAAEACINDILQRSRFARGWTVAARLAPPPDGGGETLFQPIGRLLLGAKRRGWIDRLQTLPARDGLASTSRLLESLREIRNRASVLPDPTPTLSRVPAAGADGRRCAAAAGRGHA